MALLHETSCRQTNGPGTPMRIRSISASPIPVFVYRPQGVNGSTRSPGAPPGHIAKERVIPLPSPRTPRPRRIWTQLDTPTQRWQGGSDGDECSQLLRQLDLARDEVGSDVADYWSLSTTCSTLFPGRGRPICTKVPRWSDWQRTSGLCTPRARSTSMQA